ncbi:vWA domain-containing protein [Planomonospora parontospora]|uniref:vWA domain-containing protein n=1 Tax=Planomonospora parontospora TaxID=58119 RepID=UPI001670F23A|nr:VWA domain-containing protein [Planomonospora parontospora]GGL56783.1 hypothetical protein GCM10014719_67710 [Planomonospora parontospora subsp. antibiotica]GII19979.1 hypothetical protein Ppa05_67050 [Planomonospora parontospora subsp. antibiotica]
MSEQVLPFYLVCDESYSMQGAPLDAINQELPRVHHQIASNPVVADKARFSIIGFSSTAEVLLPLSDLGDVTELPTLEARGATDYGAAFSLLRSTIEADIRTLKQAGHTPFRPTVFFLTDGQPTDSWHAEYQRLVDPGFSARPHILAFGFGEVDPATLQQIATFRAFVAQNGISPAQALGEFAKQLLQSIVRSATLSASNPTNTAILALPEQAAGYTVLQADPV